MEHVEKIVAIIGAVVVAVFSIISLRGEWRKTGLDDIVTKGLLSLLVLGCIFVVLAGFGVLPTATGANIHPGIKG
jgi:NADH:ubiquinone oxidoreductase subunit 6 (subunit J)